MHGPRKHCCVINTHLEFSRQINDSCSHMGLDSLWIIQNFDLIFLSIIISPNVADELSIWETLIHDHFIKLPFNHSKSLFGRERFTFSILWCQKGIIAWVTELLSSRSMIVDFRIYIAPSSYSSFVMIHLFFHEKKKYLSVLFELCIQLVFSFLPKSLCQRFLKIHGESYYGNSWLVLKTDVFPYIEIGFWIAFECKPLSFSLYIC